MKPELQVELLRQMKRIRTTEEIIAKRYSEWKMRCPTHLCTGQETVGAAAGLALNVDDLVVSTHRAHGHYLGKGGDLNRMMAELYTKATGCSSGKGGSMHLIDQNVGFMGSTAIVGGTIPVAVGLALSVRLKKTRQISCAFFGDGAVEEGVFYESINFAALKQLPVLFLCENNLYSVYSPLNVRQPVGRRIYKMVEAMGVSSEFCDGNDPLEVYGRIRSAADEARNGGGPRFIEFATYRWREHCGPNYDDYLGYRPEEELKRWKTKDPVHNLEQSLLASGTVKNALLKKMQEEIREEVDLAFKFAEDSPFPDTEEAFTDLYKD